MIEAVYGTDPLDPSSYPTIRTQNETESVNFSVLNAPVSGALTEAESVQFSVLNAPASGSLTEAESVPFSVLNAPVTASGIQELESVPFSVLNAPIGTAGITEADAYFTVCNQFNYPNMSGVQPCAAAEYFESFNYSAGKCDTSVQRRTSSHHGGSARRQ